MPVTAQEQEEAALVREALARSLEGINRYEALSRAARSAKVQALLDGFALDERTRVAAALELLHTIDSAPTPREKSALSPSVRAHARPDPQDQAPRQSEPELSSPERTLRVVEAPAGALTGRLTVGSLRGR